MSAGIKLLAEDIAEMRMAASAAVGLFPRIEVDPEHMVELCALAAEALKARTERDRIASILGDPAGGVTWPATSDEAIEYLRRRLAGSTR